VTAPRARSTDCTDSASLEGELAASRRRPACWPASDACSAIGTLDASTCWTLSLPYASIREQLSATTLVRHDRASPARSLVLPGMPRIRLAMGTARVRRTAHRPTPHDLSLGQRGGRRSVWGRGRSHRVAGWPAPDAATAPVRPQWAHGPRDWVELGLAVPCGAAALDAGRRADRGIRLAGKPGDRLTPTWRRATPGTTAPARSRLASACRESSSRPTRGAPGPSHVHGLLGQAGAELPRRPRHQPRNAAGR
jgi:hypothetical protein